MIHPEPTLLFFRSRPSIGETNESVISSMQALETSFFMLALRRYPHALLACATAIESGLQAANIGAKERDGLQDLFKKARRSSAVFAELNDELEFQFRDTRNRITHRGFSPQDDSIAASLYLKFGLPCLTLSYHEFHAFDLMDGLLPWHVEHLRIARQVHDLAKNDPGLDLSYCLNSFGHLIRWDFKRNFSAGWEIDALDRADEIGIKHERNYAEKQDLERLYEVSWIFDCPVCDDYQSVAAELDSGQLGEKRISLKRMACVNCGFVVSNADSQPHLSQVLLEEQVAGSKVDIFRAYGVD